MKKFQKVNSSLLSSLFMLSCVVLTFAPKVYAGPEADQYYATGREGQRILDENKKPMLTNMPGYYIPGTKTWISNEKVPASEDSPSSSNRGSPSRLTVNSQVPGSPQRPDVAANIAAQAVEKRGRLRTVTHPNSQPTAAVAPPLPSRKPIAQIPPPRRPPGNPNINSGNQPAAPSRSVSSSTPPVVNSGAASTIESNNISETPRSSVFRQTSNSNSSLGSNPGSSTDGNHNQAQDIETKYIENDLNQTNTLSRSRSGSDFSLSSDSSVDSDDSLLDAQNFNQFRNSFNYNENNFGQDALYQDPYHVVSPLFTDYFQPQSQAQAEHVDENVIRQFAETEDAAVENAKSLARFKTPRLDEPQNDHLVKFFGNVKYVDNKFVTQKLRDKKKYIKGQLADLEKRMKKEKNPKEKIQQKNEMKRHSYELSRLNKAIDLRSKERTIEYNASESRVEQEFVKQLKQVKENLAKIKKKKDHENDPAIRDQLVAEEKIELGKQENLKKRSNDNIFTNNNLFIDENPYETHLQRTLGAVVKTSLAQGKSSEELAEKFLSFNSDNKNASPLKYAEEFQEFVKNNFTGDHSHFNAAYESKLMADQFADLDEGTRLSLDMSYQTMNSGAPLIPMVNAMGNQADHYANHLSNVIKPSNDPEVEKIRQNIWETLNNGRCEVRRKAQSQQFLMSANETVDEWALQMKTGLDEVRTLKSGNGLKLGMFNRALKKFQNPTTLACSAPVDGSAGWAGPSANPQVNQWLLDIELKRVNDDPCLALNMENKAVYKVGEEDVATQMRHSMDVVALLTARLKTEIAKNPQLNNRDVQDVMAHVQDEIQNIELLQPIVAKYVEQAGKNKLLGAEYDTVKDKNKSPNGGVNQFNALNRPDFKEAKALVSKSLEECGLTSLSSTDRKNFKKAREERAAFVLRHKLQIDRELHELDRWESAAAHEKSAIKVAEKNDPYGRYKALQAKRDLVDEQNAIIRAAESGRDLRTYITAVQKKNPRPPSLIEKMMGNKVLGTLLTKAGFKKPLADSDYINNQNAIIAQAEAKLADAKKTVKFLEASQVNKDGSHKDSHYLEYRQKLLKADEKAVPSMREKLLLRKRDMKLTQADLKILEDKVKRLAAYRQELANMRKALDEKIATGYTQTKINHDALKNRLKAFHEKEEEAFQQFGMAAVYAIPPANSQSAQQAYDQAQFQDRQLLTDPDSNSFTHADLIREEQELKQNP